MRDLAQLHNLHAGRRCFIIGGGPSLRSHPSHELHALASELTITCNRGYLAFELLGAPSTYWTIEDDLDARQWHSDFDNPRNIPPSTLKLIPDDLAHLFSSPHVCVPFTRERWDVDQRALAPFAATPPFCWGGTVSYLMLQLAAYMGCSSLYLLGHDFDYAASEDDAAGAPFELTATHPDHRHFHPDYWPAGSHAYPAQPCRMLRAFVSAAQALTRAGVEVVNLTPNSRLRVFPSSTLSAILCASR